MRLERVWFEPRRQPSKVHTEGQGANAERQFVPGEASLNDASETPATSLQHTCSNGDDEVVYVALRTPHGESLMHDELPTRLISWRTNISCRERDRFCRRGLELCHEERMVDWRRG